MCRIIKDNRKPSLVTINELKNCDFTKMKNLLPEEKSHLLNLQKVIVLLSGPKPKTQEERKKLENRIIDILFKEKEIIHEEEILNGIKNTKLFGSDEDFSNVKNVLHGLDVLAQEIDDNASQIVENLNAEFENVENIEKLKYSLVIVPNKSTDQEMTSSEKAWIANEIKLVLLNLACDKRSTDNVSLNDALKINEEECIVNKTVKKNIKLLKEMIILIEKPMFTETKTFDAKCFNKGWDVLKDIITQLPLDEEEMFVSHLNDRDQISRVKDLITEISDGTKTRVRQEEKFTKNIKNLMQQILDQNGIIQKLTISEIPRINIELLQIPQIIKRKLKSLKKINN